MLLEKKADSSKTISDFLKYVVYSADSIHKLTFEFVCE